VAAVHNMARRVKSQTGESKSIPHGIRVDCVVEALVHHGLDDKVPFKIDKTKVNLDRWTKPDKKGEQARADYAQAVALTAEAEYLTRFKKDFEKAELKCNEAIKLAPTYARAYYVRSLTFSNF